MWAVELIYNQLIHNTLDLLVASERSLYFLYPGQRIKFEIQEVEQNNISILLMSLLRLSSSIYKKVEVPGLNVAHID